jgi:hypothetical protein
MVIIQDLATQLVLAAVDDFLGQGTVEAAFEPVRGEEQDA